MAASQIRARRLAFGVAFGVGLIFSTTLIARADSSGTSTPPVCTANSNVKVTVDAKSLQASFACDTKWGKLWPNKTDVMDSYFKDSTCDNTEKLVQTFGAGTSLKVTNKPADSYAEASARTSPVAYTLTVGKLLRQATDIFFQCANSEDPSPRSKDGSKDTCLVTVHVPQQPAPAPATTTAAPGNSSSSWRALPGVLSGVIMAVLALSSSYCLNSGGL